MTTPSPKNNPERSTWRGPRTWLLVLLALLGAQIVHSYWFVPPTIPYTEFREELEQGRVKRVRITHELIEGVRLDESGAEKPFATVRLEDPNLLEELRARKVESEGAISRTDWTSLLIMLAPMLLLFGLGSMVWRRSAGAGGAGGLLGVGRSKARIYAEQDIPVRFSDVAGVDEAKEELQEVIEFLKTPEKFRKLGGRIPKGILLLGPPGTGKTLLARAVAGEAGVPFFSISGSEFVEMFVGVGAARVRDLFTQARAKAPCIIFIDELDALGKARGAGTTTHEEREQTLNQLLVELDGFDPRTGVILMAATNRPEILDPALLRAGRFDRHVLVDRPDRKGRLAILQIHARKVPLEDPAALEEIAGMTAGMAGADLANLVNEAALLAVRNGRDKVTRDDLLEAVERVVAGLEKRNRVLNPRERERVAHHEIGHALVALSLPGTAPVAKISIIPRGVAALGYTMQVPTEDRFLMSRSELEDKIAVLLGGRTAEELVFGEVSTGAQDDLAKATAIARSMVKAYGMSGIGPISVEAQRPLFLEGATQAPRGDYSEAMAQRIDEEISRIVEAQQGRTRRLLSERLDALKRAAAELLRRETLSGAELAAFVEATPEGGDEVAGTSSGTAA